jgi:two-component system OmpR family response regulator
MMPLARERRAPVSAGGAGRMGEIVEQLYGDDDAREANAVEALMAWLRRKLGADAIETRRGLGYALPSGAAPE